MNRFIAVVATFALLSTPLARAVSWVVKHDLTGAGFQTEFDRWTAAPYNLRLTCVSGYEEGGAARFAGIWEKQSGPAWSASHGMTAAQFNSTTSTLDAQGYVPAFVSGFTVGATRYYNAIWEYQPRAIVVAEVGLSRSDLSSANVTRSFQGYVLVYVSAFTDNGAEVYAAIWSKGVSSSNYQCRFGLTGAAFQTAFNDLAGQGFRLVGQTVALEGTTERYSGVWRKPFGTGWYAYIGLSEINYDTENSNAYYTGFRPSFLSVYTKNNQSLFNGIWTYNGGLTPTDAEPIHTAINNYMTQNSVPGLSLAIARHGRLVFAKGYGLADQSINEWVGPTHRFRIASVSKPITATAMLRLRDAGTLTSINNTVFGSGALLGTTYGTLAYGSREQAITVRHLLTHTTGWTSDGQMWNNAYGANHAAIIGWQLDNATVDFPPGNNYQYLNIDYCTAGRVIEKLSGKTYEQYVKDEVLAPSGISDMELGNQTFVGRKLREVVYYGDDPYVNIDPHRMDANGGWIAKPMDLLLFLRRIDGVSTNADIISAARYSEMHTGNSTSLMQGYGLGLIVNSSWFGHNGCMDGSISFLVHRTDGLDFAVTCNTRPSGDSCAWNLKGAIDAALNAIPSTAWPDYDLFSSVNVDYDDWSVQTFPYWARFAPGLKEDFWGPEADYDGDGIKNLMEAYFDMNPLQPDNDPFHYSLGRGVFIVGWNLPIFGSTHGVQLGSEYKTDLGAASWSVGPSIVNGPTFGSYQTEALLSARPRIFQRFKAFAP
jgi:CubicO group peptidase (beta-lactamase class C family)